MRSGSCRRRRARARGRIVRRVAWFENVGRGTGAWTYMDGLHGKIRAHVSNKLARRIRNW